MIFRIKICRFIDKGLKNSINLRQVLIGPYNEILIKTKDKNL